MNTGRRSILGLGFAALLAMRVPEAKAAQPSIEVWKDPNCGCCADWVKHLEANGFRVTVHDRGNIAARARLGVPAKLGSCHTAEIAGYAIEGHVPASEIKRLLAQRPAAVGLAVPGMPIGSPGMEQGSTRDPYDVLLVLKDGSSRVYQSYRAQGNLK